MKHFEVTDELRDRAALHALRALPAEEAVRFEAHLAEGCRTCEDEIRAFSAVTGLLGTAVPPVAPPPSLRDRLLERLAQADSAWTVVRADDGRWERGPADGMWVKTLFRDAADGRVTCLRRLEPGVRYAAQRHADSEELYVLDGDLETHGRVLTAGDYCHAVSGSASNESSTTGGCTFLQCSSEGGAGAGREVRFVTAGEGVWRETSSPDVSMRRLFRDGGAITALVRMQPGSRLPGHHHLTAEQFYILEGDAHVGGQVLHKGDYYRAARATTHGVTHTEGGCTFLLISSRLELLETIS